MARANQFGLLLWKNFLLQKRKVWVTVLEIALPAFFSLILIFIRQRVEATEVDQPSTWPEFHVDQLPTHLCPQLTLLPMPDRCIQRWQVFYYPNTSEAVNSIMDSVQTQLNKSVSGESATASCRAKNEGCS